MSEFKKKHPVLTETGDTILSVLSGSFALLALIAAAISELARRNKKR